MSLTKKKLLEKAAIDKPQKLAQKFFGEDVYVTLTVSVIAFTRSLIVFATKTGSLFFLMLTQRQSPALTP